MADTTGLFGLTPEQVQAQRNQQLDASAMQYAQLDPYQRAAMGMYQAGGRLARPVAGMFGMVDQQEEQARMMQEAQRGIDLSTPEGHIEAARKMAAMGQTGIASELVSRGRDLALKQAQTKAALSKSALDEANAEKALRDNPNLSVTEVGITGKPGWMQKMLFDKTDPSGKLIKIGDPYMGSALSKQEFHVSTGSDKVRSQIVTDNAGNSKLYNLDTGELIKDLGSTGKPTAAYEKNQITKKQLKLDIDRTITNLEEATKDNGLIDKSTGSGAGAIIDMAADFVGKATPGSIAVGELKPIYDLVLKMVPRFEGPQSDKDTASYERAAGQLANPAIPNEKKKAAAKQILRLMKERKNQFSSKDSTGINLEADSSMPQVSSGRKWEVIK